MRRAREDQCSIAQRKSTRRRLAMTASCKGRWILLRMLMMAFLFVLFGARETASFVPTVQSLSPMCPRQFTRHDTRLFARQKKKKKKQDGNTISVNRLAYRNYEIVDTLEAGIRLVGTEVKSIRDGKLNLRDGYVRPTKDGRGCVLYNVHIGKHTMTAEYFQHEETRPRPLLVHKEQARKLLQQTEQQGMTIVPLKAYFNDENRVKLQIALCKGKNVRDKRQTIMNRQAKREESRIIKNFRL